MIALEGNLEESVPLPGNYLKPTEFSQEQPQNQVLNLDSLKEALPGAVFFDSTGASAD